MKKNGKDILVSPMEYNIFRAPTDNDRNIVHEWMRAGYDRHTTKIYGAEAQVLDGKVVVTVSMSISAIYIQRILTMHVQYGRWPVTDRFPSAWMPTGIRRFRSCPALG